MILALLLAGTLTGTMSGARTSPSARPAPTYLSLGTATPTDYPTPSTCSATVSGRVCYNLTIAVNGLESVNAELRVAAHTAGSAAGTVIMMSGAQGDTFLAQASGSALNASINTYLLANGFDTVEVLFGVPQGHTSGDRGWVIAANGVSTGPLALAARMATVIGWINSNLKINNRLCAAGTSAGATLLWYATQDYGQHQLLSNLVLSSGPAVGLLDRQCSEAPLLGNGIRQSWYGGATNGKAATVDPMFGYLVGDQNGPCTANQSGYIAQFIRDSVEHDATSVALTFPNTRVDFIYGDLDSGINCTGGDCTNARWRGEAIYYLSLYRGQSSTGGLSYYVFPTGTGIGHTVHATATGADKFTQTIRDNCHANP